LKVRSFLVVFLFVSTIISQLIQAQRRQDEMVLDLLQTMEETYTFVSWAEKLKNNVVLQDIAQQILKQTIECGFFILEYTRHNSGRKYCASHKLRKIYLLPAAKAAITLSRRQRHYRKISGQFQTPAQEF
jgi:K+-sensing histidine kinase KdpD